MEENLKEIYKTQKIKTEDLTERLEDIKNAKYKLVLVRATNYIPFDGNVYPISEIPYLEEFHNGTNFANSMDRLLTDKGMYPPIMDFSEDGFKNYAILKSQIKSEYIPKISNYNSTVLFSLNGIVPDDMNNVFSEKSCFIVEPLASQIDTENIVSIMPTDTAFKGVVKLSKNAVIGISEERYNSLSEEEKRKLKRIKCLSKDF